MLRRARKSTSSSSRVNWERAQDIEGRINFLVTRLDLFWIDKSRVHCFRSRNSQARAYARIWGFSKIWQLALQVKPSYCLEVLGENYDNLSPKEKDKVLLHELAHIPRNFSGALLPHTKRGKGSFHDRLEGMIHLYNKVV